MFALSALFAAGANAALPPVSQTYLALGDSLAFGYSQQLLNENAPIGDPASAFEHGYVNDYFAHLKPRETGTQLQNLGCPGETTDSLIGNGPLSHALGTTEDPSEAPCAYHNTDRGGGFKLPLHVNYNAPQSQLEKALEVLAVDSGSGKPVTTLTLNIGANDQLHAVAACEHKVGEEVAKGEVEPNEAAEKKAVNQCIATEAPELGEDIGENIGKILFTLREGSKFGSINYTGKIVFVGAYNPYGNLLAFPTRKEQSEGVNDEVLPGSNFLVTQFNQGFKGVAEKFGACFADTKAKFNPQNSLEPARLQKYTNMTNASESNGKKNGPDIHPTPTGYKIMENVMVVTCG